MKVFDKASWHIDAGEPKSEIIEKITLIFSYLYQKEMLSPDGIELYNLGVDSSISLHEGMVNRAGVEFLEKNYDNLINLDVVALKQQLEV